MAKCTETCPKCGADFDKVITESDSSSRYWDCFSYERTFHDTTEFFNQSLRCENRCLKQQLAASNAEIERLKSDRQQVSDAVRVACELLTFDNGGNFGAAMLLLSEVIGDHPHAQ